jgi:beta-lactamase class D/beta-lactamase class D OXA-1
MKKYLVLVTLIFFYSFAQAANVETYFQNKTGCFLLYNVNLHKLVEDYNPSRCAQQIPPDSTFKIALSLMAFDQNLINQNAIFKWDGKNRGLKVWNRNQTPKTWLSNSAVWVSQGLAQKLGMKKINDYLQKFNYGNQNFSGDPGKNNGLTQAWLSSSLKISADEQLTFLEKLLGNKLPVSQYAIDSTKANMYLETSPHGWRLYGKTGSGSTNPSQKTAVNWQQVPQDGWFVGFVQKGTKTYIFVLNFSDTQAPNTSEAGGTRAKEITKKLLSAANIF